MPISLGRLNAVSSPQRNSEGSPYLSGTETQHPQPPGVSGGPMPRTCTLKDHIVQAPNLYLLLSLRPHRAEESLPPALPDSADCTPTPSSLRHRCPALQLLP